MDSFEHSNATMDPAGEPTTDVWTYLPSSPQKPSFRSTLPTIHPNTELVIPPQSLEELDLSPSGKLLEETTWTTFSEPDSDVEAQNPPVRYIPKWITKTCLIVGCCVIIYVFCAAIALSSTHRPKDEPPPSSRTS